jgi:3-oxoacyl-[acyl-carrier-protein] synthase-3
VSIVRSQIIGCGAYLPETVLTNADLAKRVDTSDSWIVERTGIQRRRIARDGETTSDLALKAAEAALADADVGVNEIDLIIVATTTPDETFPATATRIQARLGMTRGAAFDVQAVCSGFIFGLSVADNFIKAGQARTVLLIGAEATAPARWSSGQARGAAIPATAVCCTLISIPTDGCTICST